MSGQYPRNIGSNTWDLVLLASANSRFLKLFISQSSELKVGLLDPTTDKWIA